MSLILTPPKVFSAFPYSPPYPIQEDLMHHLYECIEHKKVSIVESPTGTVSAFSRFHFTPYVFAVLIDLSGQDTEPLVCKSDLVGRREGPCTKGEDSCTFFGQRLTLLQAINAPTDVRMAQNRTG
jgi:hypothetical protein